MFFCVHYFATREERLQHPVCGLISDNAWTEIFFNGRDLPQIPHLFSGTLEQWLGQEPGDLSYEEKKSVLFILLLRFPEASLEIIQGYAQNTLKLSGEDLVECIAALGQVERLKILNKPQHYKIAFKSAALNGHLEVLKWLAKQVAPDEFQRIIRSKDYDAFRSAARKGHLEVLKWLAEQVAPNELQEMIRSEDYDAFIWAASNGHLEVLKWLAEQVAPNELQEMILSEDYDAFIWAARNGHLEMLKWLAEQVPDELQAMIRSGDYVAFRLSAENGHLEALKWFAEQVPPNELPEMIRSQNYQAFSWAAREGHTEVVHWLLQEPFCFAYAESHLEEYDNEERGMNIVGVFTSTYLSTLRNKKEHFELEQPNGVFDISDAREARLCFYMLRYLIRRNERHLDEGLDFLLSLPSVRALVHQEENELLRLA